MKALIIEDNENNLELISFILQKNGYRTTFAVTGIQGIEMAETEAPDFILLDIQLPDISGTEVLSRLKSMDQVKHIPVIAVTSYAMAGDRQRLLAAGCDGYIEKPIDPMQFIDHIKIALGEIK